MLSNKTGRAAATPAVGPAGCSSSGRGTVAVACLKCITSRRPLGGCNRQALFVQRPATNLQQLRLISASGAERSGDNNDGASGPGPSQPLPFGASGTSDDPLFENFKAQLARDGAQPASNSSAALSGAAAASTSGSKSEQTAPPLPQTPPPASLLPDKGEGGEEKSQGLGVRAVLAALAFYRNSISPLMQPSCRYVPSCSQYSIESYKRFGVSKGTVLTAWRIMRCNPLGGNGWDPPAWPPRGLGWLFQLERSADVAAVVGTAGTLYLLNAIVQDIASW